MVVFLGYSGGRLCAAPGGIAESWQLSAKSPSCTPRALHPAAASVKPAVSQPRTNLMPDIQAKTRTNTRNKSHTKPTIIRNSLGRAFLQSLEEDFWEYGPQIIAKLRQRRPLDYLKLIVTLVPEELLIEKAIEDMTDEELATALDTLRPIVAAKLAANRRDETATQD